MANHFRANLRELRFFLWELMQVDRRFLGSLPHQGVSREDCDALLERGYEYAMEMAACFRDKDFPESALDANENVVIPEPYANLWQRWVEMSALGQQASTDPEARGAMPMPVKQAVMEMLMGANPAFMCFGGFTPPASMLLRQHGTPAQKEKLQSKLDGFYWDACYCATERGAGSDLLAIKTHAWQLDESTWSLEGEKHYITAGMHDLTENTIYIVLARLRDSRSDSMFLSCFLVPRLWIDDVTGDFVHNHVRCTEVQKKMGFKGCPNTRLTFGSGGTTKAWLLGDRRNAGLLQFMTIARHARVNSGLFATGIASTAYLNSLTYARERVQGRQLDDASNPQVQSVQIIVHADVQRMLLDMKSRLEACRYLIGRVTTLSAQRQRDAFNGTDGGESGDRFGKLIDFLVPIVKTYTAEQSLHICNVAMQVHGGIAYTADLAIEQYLRDARILSIWEGTTYVQSLLLIRDVLGYGRGRKVLDTFESYIQESLDARDSTPAIVARRAQLMDAWWACRGAMEQVDRLVKDGRLNETSHYFTRIAEAFGATLAAWGLLESAQVSVSAMATAACEEDRIFYEWKMKAMEYFFDTILPAVTLAAEVPKGELPDYTLADPKLAACMECV